MAEQFYQSRVKEVMVNHHKSNLACGRRARLVVWASTFLGHRVWVRTIEGGLDNLATIIKTAMFQKFFTMKLIGKELRYFRERNDYVADSDALPEGVLGLSYREIRKLAWPLVLNIFGSEVKRLNWGRAMKAVATRKDNRTREDLERRRFEGEQEKARCYAGELEKKYEDALHLWFVRGRNPKHGNLQWQADYEGTRYILTKEDAYSPKEGMVPVKRVLKLAPTLMLVKRI